MGVTHEHPRATSRAIEIVGGAAVDLPGVGVTTAQNSHYSFAPASWEDARFKSLSYCFDTPERSIVYTGDTGPSAAVERLAKEADLLLGEMMNADAMLADLKRLSPTLPPAAMDGLQRHLVEHHVSAEQVDEMASRAS